MSHAHIIGIIEIDDPSYPRAARPVADMLAPPRRPLTRRRWRWSSNAGRASQSVAVNYEIVPANQARICDCLRQQWRVIFDPSPPDPPSPRTAA